MATSIIKVYNTRAGRPEPNAKVVLGWNGIANLGHSSPAYTDSNGTAVVNHSSTGEATVYVNGKEMNQKIYTPGEGQFDI
jgi:hypothetical protein